MTLVSLRRQNGWYQKDVVKHLYEESGIKITESYYGMIEQGVRTPSLELAVAISNIFGRTVDEIFFEDKPNDMLGKEQPTPSDAETA
jgi:putative transcriptional regulator